MKLVAAVIRPFKLDEVRHAVADLGLQGVTVTDVLSYGGAVLHREIYRAAMYAIDFAPRTKIELAVDDAIVEPVVEAIGNVARSGRTANERSEDSGDDGHILVTELQQVIRVRTGETGPAAL
jgi:nitrogen regulatory protein P-II 2